MRPSLSLHLALYRKQRALIRASLENPSPAFRAYEARYRRRTGRYTRALAPEDVHAQLLGADVVYVGDYHTLKQSQQTYLELVELARQDSRPVVMAVEFIEGRHQRALDAFLNGELSADALADKTGHGRGHPFALWENFRPVLEHARAHRIPVLAIDRRASGARSLNIRDSYAAERILSAVNRSERPRVLVLMGQYHVVPGHLPACVRQASGTPLHSLVVYQNCEALYWRLLREGVASPSGAYELRAGELCLFNASPVLCQQSFLDYLDAEAGDEPLVERAVSERFREAARMIGDLLEVDVTELDEALRDVEVLSTTDDRLLVRLQQRGRFNARELAQLRRHALEREGCYVPRARMAFLGSLSLNHAAEEAAHFVRHLCVGEAFDRPRERLEAFYARCIEEALGFFGSRLVNPQRHCPSPEEWTFAFEGARGVPPARGEHRQVAAFVLAHRALEQGGGAVTGALLPLHEEALFHGVSHGLGYLLGDALHRAFDAGTLSLEDVRWLFRDALESPQERYFALVRGEVRGVSPARSRAVHHRHAHRLG